MKRIFILMAVSLLTVSCVDTVRGILEYALQVIDKIESKEVVVEAPQPVKCEKIYDDITTYYIAPSKRGGRPAVWESCQDCGVMVTTEYLFNYYDHGDGAGYFADDFTIRDLTITSVHKSVHDSDYIFIGCRNFCTSLYDIRTGIPIPIYGVFLGEITKGKFKGCYAEADECGGVTCVQVRRFPKKIEKGTYECENLLDDDRMFAAYSIYKLQDCKNMLVLLEKM